METFSKEINQFQKYGTYTYKFDEGGNLIFNKNSSDFNQVYLSIPLLDYFYDKSKIESFYDLSFKEFLPTVNEITESIKISEDIVQLTNENQQLKEKLVSLTELSDANITESERLAMRQVILDLRIQLKQGMADRDFSDVFPYLPLTKNN